MKLSVDQFHNGSTINLTIGDTLTVTLPYSDNTPRLTAWSFVNFDHSQRLNQVSSRSDKGIRTMDFVAKTAGTSTVSMEEHNVLGFPGSSSLIRKFQLTVSVA